jgi:DNA mismatch endonuclease (patch repair protein)
MKAAWANPETRARLLRGSAITAQKNTGRIQDAKERAKRSEALKLSYQMHPERREQLREFGRRLAASPYHHKDKRGGSYARTPEIKAKISAGVKRYYKEHPERLASACAALIQGRRALRHSKLSSPERIIEETLIKAGLVAKREFSFANNLFILDFAFVKQKVAILVDGCFWHCCPIHYPWAKYEVQQKNLIQDRKREKALARAHWRVFHIWEHEVVDVSALSWLIGKVQALCVFF